MVAETVKGRMTTLPLSLDFVERFSIGRWRLELSAGPTYSFHRLDQESAFGYSVVKSVPAAGRPDLPPGESFDALAVPLKIPKTSWSSWGANAGAGVKVASMDGGIHKDAPMFDGTGYTYPAGFPIGDTRNTNGKIIASRVYFRTWDPPAPGDLQDLLLHQALHPGAHGVLRQAQQRVDPIAVEADHHVPVDLGLGHAHLARLRHHPTCRGLIPRHVDVRERHAPAAQVVLQPHAPGARRRRVHGHAMRRGRAGARPASNSAKRTCWTRSTRGGARWASTVPGPRW